MTEVFPDNEPNPWLRPEVQAVLMRHVAEDIALGIYKTYIETADSTYTDPNEPIIDELRTIVRSEAPLFARADRDWCLEPRVTAYFIERVNPVTGDEIRDSYGSGMVWVGFQDETGAEFIHDQGIVSPFNQEQIAQVVRHAHELEALGLDTRRPK